MHDVRWFVEGYTGQYVCEADCEGPIEERSERLGSQDLGKTLQRDCEGIP